MKTHYHLYLGTFIGILVICLTPPRFTLTNLLPWLIGSIFPDIDHPLRYCLKHKTLKLRKLKNLIWSDFYANNQHFYPFHTLELVAFTIIFLHHRIPHFGYFLSGYLLHLFGDIVRLYEHHKNFSWMKKWSLAIAIKNLYT